MATLLDDISGLLTAETVKYIGYFPDNSVNNIVTIYGTGGELPIHYFGNQKAALRKPSFQIRVRDISYANGYSRCQAIISALDGLSNTSISNGTIVGIYMDSDILDIGKDSKLRSEFVINFSTVIAFS